MNVYTYVYLKVSDLFLSGEISRRLIGARELHDHFFSVLNKRRTHDSIMAATNIPASFSGPIRDQTRTPGLHLAGVTRASRPMKVAQTSSAPACTMEHGYLAFCRRAVPNRLDRGPER